MANRRMLGVQLDEMTVAEVEDDSAGQKGGMKEGDEILKIDGTKVADRMELGRALRARRTEESRDRAARRQGSRPEPQLGPTGG